MNISRFFVDRPVFAGVLSVLILVAGLIGMQIEEHTSELQSP